MTMDRRRFRARHGLNITTLTVKEPEEGVYKCTARNPAGISTSYGYIAVLERTILVEHRDEDWMLVEKSMATQENQAFVSIHRAPRFINQVPNLTVQPGSQVVIDVEVDAVPHASNGVGSKEKYVKELELDYREPSLYLEWAALPAMAQKTVVTALSEFVTQTSQSQPSASEPQIWVVELFSWSVNGREYRESSSDLELYYPYPNRCIAKFTLPISGEYKVIASNVHGSAMSCGYVEIHKTIPSKQMRPPITPGEHMSHNMITARSRRTAAPNGQESLQRSQMVDVYEVNYCQRSSSVPRGIRHLESHVEKPHSSTRKASVEQHPKEFGSKPPHHLPRALHKTKSEGGDRGLPQPPKFITTLPTQINLNSEEKLFLSVAVSAVPAATFMWDVNGFELRSTKNVTFINELNRSTLIIHPPVKQGRYTVTAFNDQGKKSIMTRVFHESSSTIEEIEKEVRLDACTEPNIVVESSVTIISRYEDMEKVSNNPSLDSTSSLKAMKTIESVHTSAEQEIQITETEMGKASGTVEGSEAQDQLVQTSTKNVEDSSIPQNLKAAYQIKNIPIIKSQESIPKKPNFVLAPIQNIHLAAGETLTLEARVDSTPPATLRWYVNNFEVKSGPSTSIMQPDENISIASFSKPVSGYYKVVASNIIGEVAAVTRVSSEVFMENQRKRTPLACAEKSVNFAMSKIPKVNTRKDLPKSPCLIEKLPSTLKIGFSEPLSLKVTADAIPEATFLWLLNNFELKQSGNVFIKRIAPNISELNLKRGLHGKYDVVARNYLGQDACSCKVIVEHRSEPSSKPFFIQPLLSRTSIDVNKNTELTVIVSGKPPLSFTWMLNGTTIDSDNNFQITTEDNKTVLSSKQPLLSGSIVAVEVRNQSGFARSETIIQTITEVVDQLESDVTADKTPKFVIKLEDQNIFEGDSLKCRVKINDESDSCTFEWFANESQIICGDQVLIESNGYESSLLVENICEMANVKLSAVARNQHGTSVTSASLNVSKRPHESFVMVSEDFQEESAPKIIEPLHSSSFINGQAMLLRCRIQAVPSAVITWHKDDINIEEWIISKDIVTQKKEQNP
ncbi:immunoglobulin I-set domain protein [Dictyocaulus viviparus]|uniref:Immunoglobulin I-set domain protein n=1 Tax=Dictyocaulus viviparus TaxID=29172 RepID=A0A0D8XHS2_DICVI|nr:immunoglobulin I-set domain protein [Dictyocaulus viviparus]